MHALLAPLVAHWAAAIGVAPPQWRVRWMKTKWGSCNPRAPRLWFNLGLVKVPADFIEDVVVHEMLHLVDRTHGARLLALLDAKLPDWRERQARLNAQALGASRHRGERTRARLPVPHGKLSFAQRTRRDIFPS